MSAPNVRFALVTHIMSALAFHEGSPMTSAALAAFIDAGPTLVRRTLSRLSKAGLVCCLEVASFQSAATHLRPPNEWRGTHAANRCSTPEQVCDANWLPQTTHRSAAAI